jgi:hypothetical protein
MAATVVSFDFIGLPANNPPFSSCRAMKHSPINVFRVLPHVSKVYLILSIVRMQSLAERIHIYEALHDWKQFPIGGTDNINAIRSMNPNI